MVYLGYLYAMGRLVERDRIRAYLWFDRAAADGFSAAREARDWLEFVMPEDELAEARQAAQHWQPRSATGSP
jgi:TPR repeat protein